MSRAREYEGGLSDEDLRNAREAAVQSRLSDSERSRRETRAELRGDIRALGYEIDRLLDEIELLKGTELWELREQLWRSQEGAARMFQEWRAALNEVVRHKRAFAKINAWLREKTGLSVADKPAELPGSSSFVDLAKKLGQAPPPGVPGAGLVGEVATTPPGDQQTALAAPALKDPAAPVEPDCPDCCPCQQPPV